MTNEYRLGQAAALRGCHRALGVDPDGTDHPDWYLGFDSVPNELRGRAPITGPVPIELMNQLHDAAPLLP